MKHKIILLALFLSGFPLLDGETKKNENSTELVKASFFNLKNIFDNFLLDLVDVNRVVYTSVDTLKMITWILPVYLVARYSDDMIHASFYESALHKNINQMSSTAHGLANKGVTALTVFLALLPLVPNISPDLYHTSSLFGKGVVSLAALRTLLKNTLKSRSSCRPWNEHFSNKKRAFGGFPSGHMAFAGYMSSLFGLRHGPWWGLPLSIFTSFSFFASLNCNRHYASQLVGGLGLGVIYGYSSYKLLESRYSEHLDISLDVDTKNRASLNLSYAF